MDQSSQLQTANATIREQKNKGRQERTKQSGSVRVHSRNKSQTGSPNELLEEPLCLKPRDDPEGAFSTRFEAVRNSRLGDFLEKLGGTPGPTDALGVLSIRRVCADGQLEGV